MECIYCKAEIPDGAKLCKECQSYQTSWRNWVPHLGVGITLVLLIFSMAAYLYQSGVWIIKELSWKDDVKIIEFSTVGRTTLFNSGTGSIFVQNISAETDGISHSSAFSVGKEIKPGEYFSEEHLPPFPIGTFSLNHVLTVAEMQKTRAVIVYFDKDHPKLAMFKSFHERVKEPLFVLPAKYTVNYYSNKQGKRLSKTVGCDAIYMRPNK